MGENTNLQDKTDEEIIKMVLDNPDLFLVLMRRYEAKLIRYIRRITNVSLEDAEDILQESFIKIYQNLNNFDARLKFSSWAYRITHNQVISNYRKLKARPQATFSDISEDIVNNLQSDFDVILGLDHEYNKKFITKTLNKMDAKYREVLILKFWEDRSYEEISDILKKPAGTVATLINRAKKQFKKIYVNQQ